MADTVDTLKGATFNELYSQAIEPELRRLEAGRREAVQTFGLALLAGLLMTVLEGFLINALSHGETIVPPPGWVAATMAIAGYLGYLPVRRVARQAKAGVLGSLCRPLAVEYQERGFEPPVLQTFLDLHLLPKSKTSVFEDHFAGKRTERSFDMYGATLVQGSGRSRRTLFQGHLFRITFPKLFEGVTVVLREGGWLDRFECPPGLARVGLEDPEFEETFEAFGSDQAESRVLVTPAFMAELVALETAFAGGRLRCAFVDGDLLIAMEGHNRFEIGNMFTNLVDRPRVERVVRDLAAVLKLTDSLPV